MKILVCISSVPDTTSKINFTPENTNFDATGVQFIINPHDEYMLTKALQLQAEVTAITVGTATAEPVLRKTLAIGAHNAVRINAEPSDSHKVAQQIATYAQSHNFDLIFAGKESIDYNGAIVPGLVAAIMKYPLANHCIGLTINKNQAEAITEIDGGKQYITFSLPAVVAGQRGIVQEKELIIPNMRGIMQARTKPLQVVEATMVSEKTKIEKFRKPAPRTEVKIIDKNQLSELVRLLREEAKVI